MTSESKIRFQQLDSWKDVKEFFQPNQEMTFKEVIEIIKDAGFMAEFIKNKTVEDIIHELRDFYYYRLEDSE